MISLDEYQEHALSTAIYPGQHTPLGLMYLALKLNGESGEFAEHLGKAMRDDEVAEENVSKLRSRHERDKIGGSGDIR